MVSAPHLGVDTQERVVKSARCVVCSGELDLPVGQHKEELHGYATFGNN